MNSPFTLSTPSAIWIGSFRNTLGCLQSRSRASCGFRKCTRDGCSTSHPPSFDTSGLLTIMTSLTSLKSLSALLGLHRSNTLQSSMNLVEPSWPRHSSLFYKTSLHLLDYTTAEPSENEQEESWIQWLWKTKSARRTGHYLSGSSKETAERRTKPAVPPSRT